MRKCSPILSALDALSRGKYLTPSQARILWRWAEFGNFNQTSCGVATPPVKLVRARPERAASLASQSVAGLGQGLAHVSKGVSS